jgi:hypothetical protein
MTSQTPEELDDELEAAIYEYIDFDHNEITSAKTPLEAIAPALAEIRRHAAADALRAQAKILGKRRAALLAQSINCDSTPAADAYRNQSAQAGADAGTLYRAADDVIAEGWTETCAAATPATREDPAEGCETLVENEGDYCPRHEPADDYDPSDD